MTAIQTLTDPPLSLLFPLLHHVLLESSRLGNLRKTVEKANLLHLTPGSTALTTQ